jgi:uncharacterized protein (TIGR03086 family)
MDVAVIKLALDAFEKRLNAVAQTQWTAETPCADWDVRTLVNHVVVELLWVPLMLDGKTMAEVGDRFDGDVLGSNPRQVAVSAAAAALAAASQPGAQERITHLSFGDFPASDYLGQITSDVIIHSWDLARGIGADDRFEAGLDAFVDDFLSPQVEAWRAAGAFGPAVEVDADASVQDRVLAATGRSPSWRPKRA